MRRVQGAMMAALALLALHAVPGSTSRADAQSALDCERCHGELELLRQHVQTLDQARGLLVPPAELEGSAHGELSCTRCHSGFQRFPHAPAAVTQSCAECHEDQTAAWQDGIHAEDGVGAGGLGPADEVGAEEVGGGDGVTCTRCHGVHDVVDPAALASGEPLRAMNATCAACHETQRLMTDDPHAGEAGCWTCHAPHDTDPPAEPSSWMAERQQPEVCGTCHEEVAAAWVEDVHGSALLADRASVEPGGVSAEPPTCSSCHGSHPITTAGDREFSEAAVERCIGCHERAGSTFYGSYHGKATAVGSHVAATCVDCHGAHGIYPAEHPRSMVAEANLVETCSTCHEYARAAFVQYDSHPDPLDRERNPWIFWAFVFMNTMLVGTLGVFGAHTVAWWIRTMIDRRRGVGHGGGEA